MAYRTADDFVKSVMLDSYPGMAAMVDYGLDFGGQKAYEAFYEPIRKGEINADQLHECAGDGPKLTELLAKCKHNMHPGIVIKTVYDHMGDD
jgi:hypothetical protein